VLAAGLAATPKDFDRRLGPERAEMKKDNPAEAVRAIDAGLKYFPKNDRLERARDRLRKDPRK
jgi:hypothetical protein